MNPEYVVFSTALIILVFYIYHTTYRAVLIPVRSKVDGEVYLVQNKEDKEGAADMFAHVKLRLETLVEKLEEKFGTKEPRVNLLKSRFQSKNLREAIPSAKQTSYSINKGEKIVLCIRNRSQDNGLIELNTVMFVAIHELAHVMTVSIGHKEDFWENFRFLLAHAIEWKLYEPVDYNENPKPYCGIQITDSPLETKDIPKYVNSEETRETYRKLKNDI